MRYTTTGYNNVGIGTDVLKNNTTGYKNTGIGYNAGLNSTGNANVFIGFSAGYYETGSNKLYIGNDSGASNTLIFGDFGTGDLQLGQSSGLVTVGNDLYVKGNIYYAGSLNGSAPGSTGQQPTFSRFVGGSVKGNIIKHGTQDHAPTTDTEKISSEQTQMTTKEATQQIALNTEEVKEMRRSVGQHAAM